MRSSRAPSMRSQNSSAEDSTEPAESPIQIVWTKIAIGREATGIAENGQILRSFLVPETAGRKVEDCYTFERFASNRQDIRTAYYYHYKKYILGLKEETTWS